MRLFTSELVKKYKARTVVNHVSIDVNQGEIVGLLGPNGAGKTTTFYMIVGLIKPNEGKIFLEDNEGRVAELTDEPVYRRAQMGVGYLAQEASVFRRLSVEDNIRAVLEMTRFSKEYQAERVEALIKEFRLEKVRKSMGIQLSGGERRRTEIARAVAINPAFILLDEPFAGVDPIAVEDIQSIVATLKNKNIGVIITDHNVDETLAITDRAYLLYEGKVLKTGSPEELAADPENAIWASTSNCAAARRSTACGNRVPKRSTPFRKPMPKLRTSSPTRRRTNTYNDRIVKPLRTTLWIDPSRRGRYKESLLPPARKVTRSAPLRRRFWQRENPHCVTSNCATTPARPCAASKRWAPTSRSSTLIH